MFMIVCLNLLFFCGKGDNSNLNIDISKIQLAMNWITDKYASKTPQPNELKLGRKHLWKALITHRSINKPGRHRQFIFMIVCFKKTLFFCGKGDNCNLNIDIGKIQLAMNWITDKYAFKILQPNELKLGRKHLWKALIADFFPIL